MSEKTPFSPAEFDLACRELEQRHPACWATSGYRGMVHNLDVGGHPGSKHTVRPCMARDYTATTGAERLALAQTAGELGLWYESRPHGTGAHVHIQGLPPGPIPHHFKKRYQEG